MPYSPSPAGFVSIREIAEQAGVSKKTVLRAVEAGELKGFEEESSKRIFIETSQATEWVQRRLTLTQVQGK